MPCEREEKLRSATVDEVGWFLRRCIDGELNGIWPMLFDPDRLRECDEFVVTEYGGQVIGVAALACRGIDGHTGPTLATLYVSKRWQKKGVGLRLCEEAIRRSMRRGERSLFCDVTTKAMHNTIEKLSPELQQHMELDLSYQRYGDEWETLAELGVARKPS